MSDTPTESQVSLSGLLGGGRAAFDASVPGLAFVAAWLVSGRSVLVGASVAIATGLVIALVRWRRGARVLPALAGLGGVVVAAGVVLYTGRASDFFLTQLLSNGLSAIAWTVSILVRRPLLGLVVGAALRQRTRWRRDPDLLLAYSRASWVWVGQYLVRLAVFTPLWIADATVALGAARAVLSWPLVALCVAVSGAVLVRSLPDDHPGLRTVRSTGRISRGA